MGEFMAVRFITGRAGSGKSSYCISSLRQQLAAEPCQNSRLILLVPEQASLQSERYLIGIDLVAGSTRGEVLSFSRFAQRILQSSPTPWSQVLTPVGRVMVLQKLLGDLGNKLKYFSSHRLLPGLYQQLAGQINELVLSDIKPQELSLSEDHEVDTESLQSKLHDLRLIYAQYLSFLDEGFVDPVMCLDHARQQLSAANWLASARVWVDGFASFSNQETNFLVSLAERVERMEIALLLDPQADGFGNDQPPDPFSLFAPIENTYHLLRGKLRCKPIEIEPDLHLPDQETPERFSSTFELGHLERNIFGKVDKWDQLPKHIELFQARNLREEMDGITQRICELVSRRDDPLRYRDIAIITRQLDEHQGMIRVALQQHNIPYFIDRRPPLSEHPVYPFLLALLRIRRESFSVESVRPLLKSELLGLPQDDLDRLENYILGHGLKGLRNWTTGDWSRDPLHRSPFDEPNDNPRKVVLLTAINNTRRSIIEKLQGWIGDPKPAAGASGRIWAGRLFQVLEVAGVPERIEQWAHDAEVDGLTVEAAQHRAAWSSVVQMFDEFVSTLGDATLNLVEFGDSFEAGLSQMDTGLVPAAVDQIVVGSIERSRHPFIRAAFVMGMNDGIFPLTRQEQQLLNDDDRLLLRDNGLEVDPPRSLRLGEERLLAYIALTRARDHLFISYRSADQRGRSLEPSPYLEELNNIFSELKPRKLNEHSLQEQIRRLNTPRQLIGALASHLREQSGRSGRSADDRAAWNALYEHARQREDLKGDLRLALSGLIRSNEALLHPGLIKTLYQSTLKTSTSTLEQYAECPFKYFSASMLRLEERPSGEWNALQLGSLYHEILDRFTRRLIESILHLGQLSDEDIDREVRKCVSGFTSSLEESSGLFSGAQAYLWERLFHELTAALRAHRTFLAAGQCRTLESEFCFGLKPDGSVPAIELNTPKGRRVLLRGKIDRLDATDYSTDLLGFVYDYKRSRKKLLSLSNVYNGLDLQLMVYLLCLEAAGTEVNNRKVVPGGAFYLPLIPNYEDVDHPDNFSDKLTLKAYRPRGVFKEDLIARLDSDLQPGETSAVLAAALTAKGKANRKTGNDAVSEEEFNALLKHTRQNIEELCDNILDGKISVKPYRQGKQMPCTWCEYRSFCRFEYQGFNVKKLDTLSRAAVLKKVAEND